MNEYQKEYVIQSRDVNMQARLRPSAFLQLFQEMAGEHSSVMGYGYELTHPNGLMWIIVKNHVIFHELPTYMDRVVLTTWVSDRRHLLFPRYCRMARLDGTPLADCASYFVLVDSNTRQAVFPEQFEISHTGRPTGHEIALPARFRMPEPTQSAPFTVPYSYIDLNGHMSNVRYLDVTEDLLGLSETGKHIAEMTIEYANEVRLHETLTVSWAADGDTYYVAGDTDRHNFSLMLRFA